MQRNRPILATAACTVLGLCVANACAVIVATGDGRNLSPPPALYLGAWNLQGQFGLYTATPIDATHILTAAHTTNVARPFDYEGHEFNFQSTPINVPGTDLRIWTLDRSSDATTFQHWAPLYDANVDGSEVGKDFVVFGRGVPRGAAVYAPIDPGPTLSPGTVASTASTRIVSVGSGTIAVPTAAASRSPSAVTPQDLRGWNSPFAYDGKQSWGRNTVDVITNFDKPTTPVAERTGDLLTFDFDRPDSADAVQDEGALMNYDSGGGVFINSGGVWKLAGVNYTADIVYATTAEGLTDVSWEDGYARSALFDASGLYTLTDDGPDPGNDFDRVQVPYGDGPYQPLDYSSRVSTSRAYILSAIGATGASGNAPGMLVPEPATMMGIAFGIGLLGRRVRR